METVSLRQLNRWTLARQLLVERVRLPVDQAVERLAGMQAQQPSAPYIGLWSRLEGFEVRHLEDALEARTVVKTTVMRGTLHLVTRSRLADFRVATGSSYYDATRRRLGDLGVDLADIRAHVVAAVAARPRSRTEVYRLIAEQIPEPHPAWVAARPSAVAALSVTADLVNSPGDASFASPGRSRYDVLRTEPRPALDAHRTVAADYLRAYGPATTADLASWSGRPARGFAEALAGLDLVRFEAEDGRTLLDLPDAPRPPADTPVPVRLLPSWDSILLAHARRERILAPEHRKLVIAVNGDVAPTFLVDGLVAGTWEGPRKDNATLTLRPLRPLARPARRAVEEEAGRLLAWLRPGQPDARPVWA